MPRSIEFQIEPVLVAAMEQFRHSGYGGTSIKALERATGLSSGSLYNSFGDKDVIFQKALTHYNQMVVAGRIEKHLTGRPPVEGLRSLFLSLLDEPDGGSSGCLLTNSAVEFGSDDSIAKNSVQAGFEMQEKAFLKAIEQLHPSVPDIEQNALRFLTLYQGILVLFRSGYPTLKLRNMINYEFDKLEGEKNDKKIVG